MDSATRVLLPGEALSTAETVTLLTPTILAMSAIVGGLPTVSEFGRPLELNEDLLDSRRRDKRATCARDNRNFGLMHKSYMRRRLAAVTQKGRRECEPKLLGHCREVKHP